MAPSFFLSRFGISHVSEDDESSGDTVLVNDPPKIRKKPKISPFGFEVYDDVDSTSIVNADVYVRVNGDADNPSSAWEKVYKDDDGDLTVDIDIEDAVMAHNFYVKIGDKLVKVPNNSRIMDKDGDVQIDATSLFLSGLKLSNMMHKLDVPDPMPKGWEVGKFLFDAYGKMHYKTATNWEEMLMPVDDSFVPGYYLFK
jgi:hypothetical protein